MALAAILSSVQAQGGTIYSDGGTHAVNGPISSVIVSNGTTLNIQPGAAITGASNPSGIGNDAVDASGSSTINLSGGMVVGGPGNLSSPMGAFGIRMNGGVFTATGGTVQGGAGPPQLTLEGGEAVLLQSTTAQIVGGTFLGGGSGAVVALQAGDGTITISGGKFQGDTSGMSPASTGASIGEPFSISGGTFVGEGSGSALFAGLYGTAVSTISGGTFTGKITISPGGTGTNTAVGAEIEILGSNLAFTSTTITGTLLDGTPIDVPYFIYPNVSISGGGQAIVFGFIPPGPIPEPSSVVLFGLGIAMVTGLAWCRRQASNG
jgi:hypothetical protein